MTRGEFPLNTPIKLCRRAIARMAADLPPDIRTINIAVRLLEGG